MPKSAFVLSSNTYPNRWIGRGWSNLLMIELLTATVRFTMSWCMTGHLMADTFSCSNLLGCNRKKNDELIADQTPESVQFQTLTSASVFRSWVCILSPINHFCCFITMLPGGSCVAPLSADQTVTWLPPSILTERWNLNDVSLVPAWRSSCQPPSDTSYWNMEGGKWGFCLVKFLQDYW